MPECPPKPVRYVADDSSGIAKAKLTLQPEELAPHSWAPLKHVETLALCHAWTSGYDFIKGASRLA